jgi:hypothetical protein
MQLTRGDVIAVDRKGKVIERDLWERDGEAYVFQSYGGMALIGLSHDHCQWHKVEDIQHKITIVGITEFKSKFWSGKYEIKYFQDEEPSMAEVMFNREG